MAEIFAWGDRHILKLVRFEFPPDAAAYEAHCVRVVLASGLKIPAIVDVVTVNGRSGIIYERVNGPTMLASFMAEPQKLAEYADCWQNCKLIYTLIQRLVCLI